jgi:AAA15 family ATPase/GTPase
MLIQFKTANFKCFKDEVILSMRSSNYIKEYKDHNTFVATESLNLLKCAAIYGANASGKSKLIDAMGIMRTMMIKSSKESEATKPIAIYSHSLNAVSINEPTLFEIIFVYKNAKYRYGFEIDALVRSEWLYYTSTDKQRNAEIEVFYRDEQDFGKPDKLFKIGGEIAKKKMVSKNTLWLSAAAQWNDPLSQNIMEWLTKFNILSGISTTYEGFTIKQSQKSELIKQQILKMLQDADLGIKNFRIEEVDFDNLPTNMPENLKTFLLKYKKKVFGSVKTIHQVYNEFNIPISETYFDMDDDESAGTKKYFALSGPILETLENGGVLIVDELESQLHPLLTLKIIALFNSPQNKNNAQLVFTTHDTNLLNNSLRRDQIWFTEKKHYGAATLYSLSDFMPMPRSDESLSKNYLSGKYGAVPYLGDFELLSEQLKPIVL